MRESDVQVCWFLATLGIWGTAVMAAALVWVSLAEYVSLRSTGDQSSSP
jgi:hypothetical protein